MSLINTSIWYAAGNGITMQAATRSAMDASLLRIYTGNRITSARDDPQGMVDVVATDTRIAATRMAVNNNQAALGSLGKVDSALRLMLGNLLDIREAVQKSIGVYDAGERQRLLETVTDLVNLFDQYARTTTVGTQAVLAGGATVTMNAQASDLLDVNETRIRRAGREARRRLDFRGANAAEQAVIRDTYNVPAADSTIRITTDQGSVDLTIAAGTAAAAAANQIASAAAAVGATAVEDAGDIVIYTGKYGQDRSVRYDLLSGPNIFSAATISDTGADGRVNINGADYLLKDDLEVTYGDVDFSAVFAFDGGKVGVDPLTGAAPADASLELRPAGGLLLHYGPDNGPLDAARYGFPDLTAQSLDLNRITDNADSAYMFTDPDAAVSLVMDAYDAVKQTISNLGDAMGYDLQGTSSRLQEMLMQLYDQRSAIMDTDHAYEAARLAKLQMLQQSGLAAMSADFSTRRNLLSLLDVMRPG